MPSICSSPSTIGLLAFATRSERRRDGSDQALDLRRGESQTGFVHSLAVGFEPDAAVLVDDDLGDLGIGDRRQEFLSRAAV